MLYNPGNRRRAPMMPMGRDLVMGWGVVSMRAVRMFPLTPMSVGRVNDRPNMTRCLCVAQRGGMMACRGWGPASRENDARREDRYRGTGNGSGNSMHGPAWKNLLASESTTSFRPC